MANRIADYQFQEATASRIRDGYSHEVWISGGKVLTVADAIRELKGITCAYAQEIGPVIGIGINPLYDYCGLEEEIYEILRELSHET